MKKYLLYGLFLLLSTISVAQVNDSIVEFDFDNEKFLKEVADNACLCIDSISVYNKSRNEVTAEIHACIDKQCGAYQMGMKLSQIKNLNVTDGENKSFNIDFNINPESNEYKKYYYEIESYLMTNCKPLIERISANDKLGIKSMSTDPEALRYYNLGLKSGEKGEFEIAIDYYKKALVFDTEFAFAYDNMGVCYRRLNKFDEAIEAYEKSLKIDPNGLMPLQNIGVAYLYKKEYRKAIKSYERLSKIDAKNPEVFYGLGNIYAQHLFEYEKALDNLCKAYNIYSEQKSPYRSDAEKLIQLVYSEMKKQGKENIFNEILEKNGIKAN